MDVPDTVRPHRRLRLTGDVRLRGSREWRSTYLEIDSQLACCVLLVRLHCGVGMEEHVLRDRLSAGLLCTVSTSSLWCSLLSRLYRFKASKPSAWLDV